MKVFYITMRFPAKSETFAGHDVLALHKKGVDISVHSLLKKIRNSDKLITERKLGQIWITHSNFLNVLKGILFGIKKISVLINLITWIIKNSFNNKNHLLKSILLIPRSLDIFNTIEKEKPDVVHLFWGHYPSIVGYLVERYSLKTDLTMFLGAYDLEMNYGGSKPVASNAKAVFTHAKCNVSTIERLGVSPQNIIVSYRGINLEKFNIEYLPNKVNKRIVCASRLIESKGVDDVIRVFSLVNAKYPDSTLVILGDGEKKVELEKLVKSLNLESVVLFKGHVNQDALFQEMKKAEVFILLSKKQSERLPNVVKEAMLARCLCIVTKTPGIDELIDNRYTGYVINQKDFEEIHKIIDDVFTNKLDREAIVEKAFNYVTNNFDIKRLMENYFERWIVLKNE